MQVQPTTDLQTENLSEKLYDMCMIEMMCRGNQDQIKKLVKVFIDQVPQSIEEIKAAYAKGDFSMVRKVAHRIKPTLGYYAIVKIEKDILQIEALAKAGIATTELALKINKVEDVVNRIVEKMKKDFI